jgi:hypothetical protein
MESITHMKTESIAHMKTMLLPIKYPCKIWKFSKPVATLMCRESNENGKSATMNLTKMDEG